MKLNSSNYVDEAEKIIQSLIETDRNGKPMIRMTTSKIRNILSMVSELYGDIIHESSEQLDKSYVERIQYLRLRIAYEAGRDRDVKNFVNKTRLLDYVKAIGNSKSNFLLFEKYMEALVAYHRFYGGND